MVSVRESGDEKNINHLKRDLLEIKKKKNALILDNDVSKAYQYLKRESVIENEIDGLEVSIKKMDKVVSLDDIALVIHKRSGIPIYEIM